MRTLAILSDKYGWHVRDLFRAADALQLQGLFLPVMDLGDNLTATELPQGLQRLDLIMVRSLPMASLERIIYRMDWLHRMAATGKLILNSPLALEACIDKYATTWKLSSQGISVPKTVVAQTAEQGMEAFAILGGDVVYKPLFGSMGKGIERVKTDAAAYKLFSKLEQKEAVLYLQRFIESKGYDIRVFVLGGKVLAAMKRENEKDWRYNASLGAKTSVIKLSEEQESLAIRSAKILGVDMAGVDLITGSDGQEYVLEVNAVPGWQALSETVKIDVAAEVLKYCMSRVQA